MSNAIDTVPRYGGEYGTWMVYDYTATGDIHLVASHTQILKAVEILRDLGKGKLGFLPLGMDIDLAVEKWEKAGEE